MRNRLLPVLVHEFETLLSPPLVPPFFVKHTQSLLIYLIVHLKESTDYCDVIIMQYGENVRH